MVTIQINIIALAIYFNIFLCSVSCYKLYSALNSIVFTDVGIPTDDIHSEYYFGLCSSQEKKLLTRHILGYDDVKGKIVYRGWLYLTEVPTCVYIRARSAYSDFVRYNAFKINICICIMQYNYGGMIFRHYYYEWLIPVEMMKEMTWELRFYSRM